MTCLVCSLIGAVAGGTLGFLIGGLIGGAAVCELREQLMVAEDIADHLRRRCNSNERVDPDD